MDVFVLGLFILFTFYWYMYYSAHIKLHFHIICPILMRFRFPSLLAEMPFHGRVQFKLFFTPSIIPTHCLYRFFGDIEWSVGKIKSFLHFDKNPWV